MRRVFLSFLGRGSKNKGYRYDKTRYELNGKISAETEFVQVAELQLLGDIFDQILIVATRQSFDEHYVSLTEQAIKLAGTNDGHFREIIIEEDMKDEGQWKWFEKIFSAIEEGDRLTVDLTHGYRSVPIVFSTALNFLQKTKGITLEHVFYGAFEQNRNEAPVVDMRSFFDINLWADAVTRLTEEADAQKITEAAQLSHSSQLPEFNDDSLIKSFEDITDRIRNVDVDNIAKTAHNVTKHIRRVQKKASASGKILLQLAEKKFSPLALPEDNNKLYENDYFGNQIQIIKVLIEHDLYMQAFTAMREFLVSVGERHAKKQIEILIEGEWKDISNKKKKTRRNDSRRYADKLIGAFSTNEKDWNFSDLRDEGGKKFLAVMEPFLKSANHAELIEKMKNLCIELRDYRNGFDHAWTGKGGMKEDIKEKAADFFRQLEEILPLIERL
ncbi:MAG: TIGR02221 family CRISPR-associated protein [Desulfobulbaceae bacterium]|jgi:hypothetical protein|nr:TIGR02221 family CRISPR-associated protein [Deltaproteobacteria bacterium]MDD3620295.1 TIGR02221 family CRISPR-associated protein [Desulfobulbaceae bacterium]MDY0352274.1 TIGR02221 family CRISPR-associated protein [Desulfobulbaceae bacterium]